MVAKTDLPFRAPVREWFKDALGEPTRAQSLGWPPITRGESTLILAPTGSGKTLAAFLSAIDRLAFSPAKNGVSLLYVSPLKALAVDVERNLRAPLGGVLDRASNHPKLGVRELSVFVRTGDTPQAERVRALKHPPDILITTPESLYLMLTSGAQKILSTIDTVIVDEIHQLVATKRGAHLFVSLERLEALRPKTARPLQRIGLSATQRPLDEVARALGGYDVEGAARPVTIVDAGAKKDIKLFVSTPDIDMARLGEVEEDPRGSASRGAPKTSIWPHLHQKIVGLVREHRSTMVFVNSRRLAERLATALNEVAGEEIALAHHGSVAREKRAAIEDSLKRGDLRAIVATSSLELGIDMGAVDLVIQVEAPPSIASGLQRVGRASHQVGGVPEAMILPKHRADLLAATAAAEGMREGDVEPTAVLRNPLDVLAQQIVAITSATPEPVGVAALYRMMRQASPFHELPITAFEGVLDMLSGLYPSDAFAELRARVTWDRTSGTVQSRQGSLRLAIANGGTIPDRGLYGVFLVGGDDKKGGRRVGELDEEMVFELREGEVFLLGASSWRAEEITLDRVLVTPASGEPGKMPFWHGDRVGRSRDLGARIGKLARSLSTQKPGAAERWLGKEHGLDASAARNLSAYVHDQMEAAGVVPSDKTIVVERFMDEIGDERVCVMTPFGMRVHAPWAMAALARLRAANAGEPDVVWSDDGIVFRITATDRPPSVDVFLPTPEEVDELVKDSLAHSSLFASRFRENAARALLLPRRMPGKRTPLWAQRKRASDLLAVASKFPSFPIVLETYREVLRDVFDLPGLKQTLEAVVRRSIKVVERRCETPSPFAQSLLFSFVANFIYDGDAPLAERRAHALAIDHAQLGELLGEAELRQLFDEELIVAHERVLQRLESPAKHADGLHDLLLFLGDLSLDEIRARTTVGFEAWLVELEQTRRIAWVKVAGERRAVAVEDAARYRDALGAVLPRGLPDALLASTTGALGTLVARFARTHGPFTIERVASRLGVGVDRASASARLLVGEGTIVSGAFLPAGLGIELCHKDVLASLRRRALASLRREVEPVDEPTFARFVLAWQNVDRLRAPTRIGDRRSSEELIAAITQLEACPLVASALESDVLPARVSGYRPFDLDALCASGAVVWAGVEPIGASDGRVAFFLAEHEPLLTSPPSRADGEIAAKIREALDRRGASFFVEVARHVGGMQADVRRALWDMIWCGEVTNDTVEPLRALVRESGKRLRPGLQTGREGRYSLRERRWEKLATDTERRAALARTLLDRYGIVTRDVAVAESLPGGFGAVYEVYKAMEDAGRVRRGYFAEGRGGAQFALSGAADRLRSMRSTEGDEETPRGLWLAATDPANPYGALLPWPQTPSDVRPQRAAGAHVIIHQGRLVGFVGRGNDALLTFLPVSDPERAACARALARALADRVDLGYRRAWLIASVDRASPADTALGPALAAEGFVLSSRGWQKRRTLGRGEHPPMEGEST